MLVHYDIKILLDLLWGIFLFGGSSGPLHCSAKLCHQRNDRGIPIMAKGKQIWLITMRMQVQSLASLSGLRIWGCHELGVGCRCSLDLVRPVATASIWSLAWEFPYATDVALKRQTNKQTKGMREESILVYVTKLNMTYEKYILTTQP